MPCPQKEKTLQKIIGNFPPLMNAGDIDKNDIYHNFKPYSKHMLPWIEKIKEGESAFDNRNPKRRPHKIVNGEMIPNTQKMAINIRVASGINQHHAFIQEMICYLVKQQLIQKTIVSSVLEN